MFRLKFMFLFVVFSMSSAIYSVDFIVFSYDRPMQLYALLESTEKYISGLSSTTIIYRTSDAEYESAYAVLKNTFQWADFIKQNTVQDFRLLTVNAINQSPSEYIMFGVDDLIIKDFINLSDCANALKNDTYYAFYLRLGLNINCSYPSRAPIQQPPLKMIDTNLYMWALQRYQNDWHYPNTVDMAIYRKKNVAKEIASLSFVQPNQLEERWVSLAFQHGPTEVGLCFEQSKVVNIPINRVQNEFHNPNMNLFSPAELLAIFNRGKKIDIGLFYQMNNGCPHWAYEPKFVDRN